MLPLPWLLLAPRLHLNYFTLAQLAHLHCLAFAAMPPWLNNSASVTLPPWIHLYYLCSSFDLASLPCLSYCGSAIPSFHLCCSVPPYSRRLSSVAPGTCKERCESSMDQEKFKTSDLWDNHFYSFWFKWI